MLAVPSPSQSPAMGTSPLLPNATTRSAAPGVLLLRRWNLDMPGRYTATVTVPSHPNRQLRADRFSRRTRQRREGSLSIAVAQIESGVAWPIYAPTVVLPFPSQSPARGGSPTSPNATFTSENPGVRLLTKGRLRITRYKDADRVAPLMLEASQTPIACSKVVSPGPLESRQAPGQQKKTTQTSDKPSLH